MNLAQPTAMPLEPIAVTPPRSSGNPPVASASDPGEENVNPATGECLHAMLGARAAVKPDAVAVIDGAHRITYRALEEAANRLARRLRAQGVTREHLVGVCLARSWRLIVALLAVLKAGGAYVPLDPAHPAHRLRAITQDAGLSLIITETDQGLDKWAPAAAGEGPALFLLDERWESLREENADTLAGVNRPADLAYVIYTSGSTGQPKGVALTHQNAVSFVKWARDFYRPEEFDGVLAATSISFDLSIFELFATLGAGGRIILAENALALPGLPAANEIRLINTVPSVMSELLRAQALPPSIITVSLAGEPLATALVDRLYAHPGVQRVYDLYGPTECTTYATCALRRAGGPATIGRAIANTQVFILDRELRPAPAGEVGELCIGGEGVARGYWGQPALTARQFVRSPHLPAAGRLYRTGDLGRWREDGDLEYLGRRDHQVKIRGFRIELGEIEAVLRQHPGVRECVVLARPDPGGNAALVGYVIGEAAADPASLRAHLHERLPDHMVPAVFVPLERLPLTANGKLDRAALPAPPAPASRADTGSRPRTLAEEIIAELWCDVLGRKQVGVTDDFFELGGHSLLALRLISRINAGFGIDLSVQDFFRGATVAQLAALAEKSLLEEIEASQGLAAGDLAGV